MKKLLSLLVALICAITVNATELFMVGDATPAGWDLGAALNTQQMEEVSTNVFEWTGVLAANSGEGFKILAGRDWNPGLHPSEAALKIDQVGQDVVALPYSGDPDTKWQVSVTGNYTIRVTLRAEDALVECIEAGAITVDVPCVDGVYQLSTATHAANFAEGLNSGTIDNTCSVVLVNDLDLASIEKWVAIGTDSKKFMGTFDGQGHRILNMHIDGSKKEQGFFGVVGPGALIQNTIIDASCVIVSTDGQCMSAFVGCVNNDGTITFKNCGNEANVVGTKQNNAAFVGCNYGGGCHLVFENCYNVGKISGGWENGAFSGWCGGGAQFINCYNAGEVTEGETWARGGKEMTNCYQTVGADGGVNQVDAAFLASGELCVLLNNGTDVWKQTLGEAAYPTFTGKVVYAYSDGTYGNVEAPDSKFEAWDGENAVIIPANKWTSAYDAHSVTYTADYGYGDWNTGNPNYNVIIGTPGVDAAGKNWYEVGYNMLSSTDSWVYNQFDPRFGPNENPGDVYVVRYFTANGELPETVYLAAPHDDAPCEYYINGVKVFSRTGYEGVDGWFEDEVVRLNDEQKALIKTDGTKNVFAFHVHQNWGGRFADGGLYTEDTNAAKRFLNDDARKRLENAIAQAKTVEGFDAEVIAYAEERTTYIQEAGRALDKIRFELRKALSPRHDFSAIASATPADGLECYIYNEATGLFLAGGNDWGTHTTVEYFMGTRPMVLHANTSGANRFAIQTNLPNGIRGNADGLGHNGYVDCPHGDDFYSNEGWAWTFEALEDGTYHIIQSGREGDAYKYLGVREDARYQVDTDCPGDESAWNKWRIISKEQMEALVATASEDNGVDMSYKIHQANFSQNDFDGDNKDIANGDLNDSAWERNAGSIWNWKGNDAMGDYVFEAWFTPADVDLKLSQVIEGLPAGNYKVGVTGYYRDGNYDSAIDGNNRQLAYLYAGTQDNQVLLPSILDGAGKGAGWGNANHMECLIPDGCREAPKFFQLGTYKTEIDAVVGEDGKLEIGVCRPGEGVFERDWVVVDNFTLTYYGEPYTPAEFVSITPAPEDGEITLDTEFVVTFTEAVEFNEDASGIGMGAGFVNPTLFEKSEDGKVITVKFDKETLAEMLGGEISDIHALDEFSEGKFYVELFGVKDARTGEKLAGNSEDKTPGIYHWDYTSGEAAAPALIVTPAEGQVEKLDVIKFESTGNFIFPSSYEGTDITITDADGNVVATITQDDLTDGAQVDPELMYPTSVVVELPEAITAGGTYTMTIPANAFYMSYSMQSNEATTVVYTIEEPVVLVADPAEGTVDGLQTVTIALSNNDLLTPSCSQDIVVTDADGNVVVTIDREDLSDYVTVNEDYMPTAVALPINILKQGTYTMTIPAGTFYCGMSFDANEETTFTWTVTGVLDGINNISTTDDVKTYNLGGQRVKANAKGIVIKNGKKYVVK